jgi:hypothetical protein
MKEHLWGQKFADDNEVMEMVQSWLKTMPKSFFLEGIRKLVDRWTKRVAKRRGGGAMSNNKINNKPTTIKGSIRCHRHKQLL